MIPVLHGDEASFSRILPAGFRILAALDNATRLIGADLTITCGTEGHGPDDPHTLGEGYDVRVRGLTTPTILKLLTFLHQLLPPSYFTVLLETPTAFTDPDLVKVQYLNPHATAAHLHIQKKRGTVYPPTDLAEGLRA